MIRLAGSSSPASSASEDSPGSSCFEVPAVGFFGNSGATVLNGPGLDNWDVGTEKSVPLAHEGMRLQFRAEMFNAFNHAQFQSPNGDAEQVRTSAGSLRYTRRDWSRSH